MILASDNFLNYVTVVRWKRKEYHILLNDQEFPPISLVSDWQRRHLLAWTSEWVHRKRRFAVYSGFLFLVALNFPQQAR